MINWWMESLRKEMAEHGDSNPVLAFAPNEEAWNLPFDSWSYEVPPLLAWTEDRVYFVVSYDGCGWIRSAPRHPQSHGQEPVG